MKNNIDIEFNNLMTFLKDKDVNQIKDIIKTNYRYKEKVDKLNYDSIIAYYNKQELWGTINLDEDDDELIENNAKALVNHREDYEWLYHQLKDYKSKKILLAVLLYWLMLDIDKVDNLQDRTYKQYFDLDLIKCNKKEVFVDIGAYIGDTIVEYIKAFGLNNYKRIYCYEIVPSNIGYLKQNIEIFKMKNVIIREKGASNKKGLLFLDNNEVSSTSKLSNNGSIKVDTVKVDDDIDEKVTFIKMDIEGSEVEALLGCKKKILEGHPKLAICVYHNNDHLWEIARIIHEIDPTYKFYLRYYGGPLLPVEYILYAI